jgi:hypothetical protein
MMRSCRGFLVFLLALALVLGTGWPMAVAAGKQHGDKAPDMVMSAVASDIPMSRMCDNCINKNPVIHACFVVCVGLQAVLPAASVLRETAEAALTPFTERQFHGSAAALDPPPPKLAIFS